MVAIIHNSSSLRNALHYNENYPGFLQRFPQHIISSYFGITKETLSRICKHAVTK